LSVAFIILCDYDIKLCCVTSTQENARENDKDTEIIIKITQSEIKTELEFQSLK